MNNAIWEELFSEWLTPQGVGAFLQGLLFIGFCMLFLFRKGIVKQLVEECGIATKKDLDEAIYKLRTELLRKIEKLQAEVNELRKEMEANDAKLRKAVLLLANQSIDDPERLERIKDLLTI